MHSLIARELSTPVFPPIVKSKKSRRKSKRFRHRIYWRDNGLCQYCFKPVPFSTATLDHITPLVHGGSNTAKENFCIACFQCNNEKGPLEMEHLDDLSPTILWLKFERVSTDAKMRKGHYCEYISTLV